MANRRCVVAIGVALGLALGGLAGAGGAEPKRVKQASRVCLKAERSLKAGALDRAREQFLEALEIQPGLPNALIGLGHVAMAQQSYERALERYTAARERFSEFGEAVEDLQARRYRSAQSDITALRDQINTMLQNSTSIRTQQMISQMQNQIAQLQVIEPPDPDEVGEPPAEYDFYIGNATFQLGDVDGAIAAWERCRDAKPKFAMVYNNLALAYWRQGRLDAALAALERAEELGFPVNPEMRGDLERARGTGGASG